MVGTEHSIVGQVYAAKTDPEAADALIGQYMGFIRSETVKFVHAAPEDGHEDELSIAMLAFYEAVLGYEKSRGAFLPFAARAILPMMKEEWSGSCGSAWQETINFPFRFSTLSFMSVSSY